MTRVLEQDALAQQLAEVRHRSVALCKPLAIEDYGVQPMDDASPPKWHLAHTTWFFETFVLRPSLPNYQVFNTNFEYLFNSYYNGVGERHPRPQRGLLSRPLVSEIQAYRDHVDGGLHKLLKGQCAEGLLTTIELGIHHEQQHQELTLTDLKFNLGHNPLYPIYADSSSLDRTTQSETTSFLHFSETEQNIGADHSAGFCFDNELPYHIVYLQPFELANRLVTNAEYLEFVESDGYNHPSFWLSDGWSYKNDQKWEAPEYWVRQDDEWFEYSLHGFAPLNLSAPVCHVSYYEADAYARWLNCRLPTEFEWECAANALTHQLVLNSPFHEGTFADSGHFHPRDQEACLIGDCWQWTSSSYAPYPGYRPLNGTLGEYNGKFMANQYVLRGGSCATPRSHYRNTYRNFFYPKDRWQFTGIRLARDIDT